jgi:hypothetical protein
MTRTIVDTKDEVVLGLSPTKPRKPWLWIAVACGTLLAVLLSYLALAWPFTQANVIKELQEATSSSVHVGKFTKTFFPHPGCIVEEVIFQRGTDPGRQVVTTVKKITMQASLVGMLTKHLALVRLDNARAVYPAFGTGPDWKPAQSDIVIDQLLAVGGLLEFARRDPHEPHIKFFVPEFTGHHLAAHDPMKFEVRIENPTPPGEINAQGTFGPWKLDQLTATPVSGNYTYRNADLGMFAGIRGTLSSDGQFTGALDSIAVEGTISTPNFAVRGSTHQVNLKSQFHAEVDATNGDVTLHQVWATLLHTTVSSRGSIASHPNRDGKTANLDLAIRDGHIQDLLLMFISEKQAPINGVVSLSAKSTIPPGEKPFLQRIEMAGDFGIKGGVFTKQTTQSDLNKLSAAAQGEGDQQDDPERAVSDLEGRVIVKNGIATFSDLSFHVPGALAKLHGTFDLSTQRVDLKGVLLMKAKLPQATSGIKSFLLKALDPFLKKNRVGGAKVPVSITGTYQHPVYRADPV